MKRLKKILGVTAVVVDITLSLTGCVSGVVELENDWNHSGNVEVSVAFSRTLPLTTQTAVRITGANGAVRVWGDPGAEAVIVDAVRTVRSDTRADAAAHLPHLKVVAEAKPIEFEIRTIQPSNTHGRTYVVDYDVTVPAHLLTSITNGNGSIQVEGIVADVDVINGNGEVDLVGIEGSHWVSLGNGEVSARAHLPVGGQIVHAVGNGTISLTVQPQVSASFGAKVGNGTISVTGLNLQEVVSGPRQLQGVLGSGEGLIDLSAGNGQIRVKGG
jgi:hypothetical protein